MTVPCLFLQLFLGHLEFSATVASEAAPFLGPTSLDAVYMFPEPSRLVILGKAGCHFLFPPCHPPAPHVGLPTLVLPVISRHPSLTHDTSHTPGCPDFSSCA